MYRLYLRELILQNKCAQFYCMVLQKSNVGESFVYACMHACMQRHLHFSLDTFLTSSVLSCHHSHAFSLQKCLVSSSPLYYCAFFHSKDAISVGAIYVPAQLKVILDLNLHFKIHVDCYGKKI